LICNKATSFEFQIASEDLCTDDPVASAIELVDYADPYIRSLYTSEKINQDGTPDQDNVNIKILGSSFGMAGLVYIMPKDMSTPWQEAPFILHDNGAPKFKDSEIEVISPYTSGYVKVRVGERDSRPIGFDDKSPEILDVNVIGDTSSTLLDSDGGNIVVVVGKHFGVEPQLAIGGMFCEIYLNEFVAGSYADRVIYCLAPRGQGSELKVEVMVGKKVSCSDFKLSYRGPQIMAFDNNKVSPPHGSLVPTTGGTYLFAGQNFGTGVLAAITDIDRELALNLGAGSNIGGCNACNSKQMCDVATPPPAALEFWLVSSSESLPVEYVNSTHLLVTMPPGVGTDLEFGVNVGGQNCLYPGYELCDVKLTLDYASPTVATIQPRVLQTDGSTVVTFLGNNFGCCNDDCGAVCDRYDLRRKLVNGTVEYMDFEEIDAPSVYMDGRVCELIEFSNEFISCLAPEGQGMHINIIVTVGGQQYTENAIDVSYEQPIVDSFTPTHGPTEGNITVTLFGSNFGRGGVVQLMMGHEDRFGFQTFHDGSDVAMPSDSIFHSELLAFLESESTALVLLLPSSIKSWNHTTVVFTLPEGQGRAKSFEIKVGAIGQLHDLTGCLNDRDCYFERQKSVQVARKGGFHFDSPSIHYIDTTLGLGDGKECPSSKCDPAQPINKGSTLGEFWLTIVGENFGTLLGRVFVGADPRLDIVKGKECYNVTQSHREVTCLFPPGIGTELDIIFVQQYPEDVIQQLGDTLNGGFDYYPPVIEMILPGAANALGDELEITGREFGREASSIAISMGHSNHSNFITCTDASLSFRSHGSGSIAILQCDTKRTTVGERALVVNVAGQMAQWDDSLFGSFEFSCKVTPCYPPPFQL
jgi:hypothetical protein